MNLNHIVLFKDLTDAEKEKVKPLIKVKNYIDGSIIIEKNIKINDIYFVSRGTVKVDVPQKTIFKKQEKIAILEEGECFGELSYIDRLFTSARIVAMGPCEIYSISFEEIDKIFEDDPRIAKKMFFQILLTLSARLRETTSELLQARFFVSSSLS